MLRKTNLYISLVYGYAVYISSETSALETKQRQHSIIPKLLSILETKYRTLSTLLLEEPISTWKYRTEMEETQS